MAYGALKTLMQMLAAAPSLASVAVAFGEEEIANEVPACPKVVIVPTDGAWSAPGYIRAIEPDREMLWATLENIEVWCMGFSTLPSATPIDHADATEDLRAFVLQAFQSQRDGEDPMTGDPERGLFYKPIAGRWVRMDDAVVRFGRAYVLTLQVEIGVPTAAPQLADVVTVELSIPLT